MSAKEMMDRYGDNIGPIAYTEIDGKVAIVGLTVRPQDAQKPNFIDLKMRQLPDGYWQLMEVDFSNRLRPTAAPSKTKN